MFGTKELWCSAVNVNGFLQLLISYNFAMLVARNFDLLIINHKENWHVTIEVSVSGNIVNGTGQVLIHNFAQIMQLGQLNSVHLPSDLDLLFFATNRSPNLGHEDSSFSLHIAKLPLLKKHSDAGTIAWSDFKERSEWTLDSQRRSLLTGYEVDLALSSCKFSWKRAGNRPHPIDLVAYALMRPVDRQLDAKVWPFEASFELDCGPVEDQRDRKLDFRSCTELPVETPFLALMSNISGGPNVTQSSLGLFKANELPASAQGPREAMIYEQNAVHMGVDEEGELYFRHPQAPSEDMCKQSVYLADAFTGAMIYRPADERKGVFYIVYP